MGNRELTKRDPRIGLCAIPVCAEEPNDDGEDAYEGRRTS